MIYSYYYLIKNKIIFIKKWLYNYIWKYENMKSLKITKYCNEERNVKIYVKMLWEIRQKND